MTVEYDSEAKAIVNLLNNFGKFNDKVVDDIATALVSDGPSGILTDRFKRKMTGNKTYRDLADSTKRKKSKKQPYTMNASGDTLKAVKRTTKGRVKGNKIIMTAKVPEYAKDHNNGTAENRAGDPIKKLQFFSFNDKDDRPIRTEVRTFNKIAQTQFDKNLAKIGIKSI